MIAVSQDEWGICPEKLKQALKLIGAAEDIKSRNKGVPKVINFILSNFLLLLKSGSASCFTQT
jgi:hypothetical protein